MKNFSNRWGLLLLAMLLVTLIAAAPANLLPVQAAGNGVSFTVTVKSAYLRGGPSVSAPRMYSVFQGQAFPVIGRTSDNIWLKLDYAGPSVETWTLAANGAVSGNLNSVPATVASAPSVSASPTAPPAGNGAGSGAGGGGSDTFSFTGAYFTITAKSSYVRSDPNWVGKRLGSVFKGQVFAVIGRSYDSMWLKIDNGGMAVWIPTEVGKLNMSLGRIPVISETIPIVPVTPEAPPPPRSANVSIKPEWIPPLTLHTRYVYRAFLPGKNLNMFTVAGDCNAEDPWYLKRVVAGQFDLRGYEQLHGVVRHFAPGFVRKSLATHGGLSAATMFDPGWAHPDFCRKGAGIKVEGALECELRISQASVVFLAVGTGDHTHWQSFEANYRRMIQYALDNQVLPILVTKADDVEATTGGAPSGYINAIIRRLAAEYDVPLMDFWQASRQLPNNGMVSENPQFHLSPEGYDMRTLFMLYMLDLVWKR